MHIIYCKFAAVIDRFTLYQVEGKNTNTAAMAMKIAAVNRWCMSGTPLGKPVKW